MNSIREVQSINEEELKRGIAGTRASWHTQYSKSAWIYVGNLSYELVEGDVICVLSQYGEIEDFHLVRDEVTGTSKGFAFCKYEDARSCILAVDNFCGTKLCGRSLRVDHVENYRLPNELREREEEGVDITAAGAVYDGRTLANEYTLKNGLNLFAPATQEEQNQVPGRSRRNGDHDDDSDDDDEHHKKAKKKKKKKDKRKEERREEKHERRRKREERRMKKEDERRELRAKRMKAELEHFDDDDDKYSRSTKKTRKERD